MIRPCKRLLQCFFQNVSKRWEYTPKAKFSIIVANQSSMYNKVSNAYAFVEECMANPNLTCNYTGRPRILLLLVEYVHLETSRMYTHHWVIYHFHLQRIARRMCIRSEYAVNTRVFVSRPPPHEPLAVKRSLVAYHSEVLSMMMPMRTESRAEARRQRDTRGPRCTGWPCSARRKDASYGRNCGDARGGYSSHRRVLIGAAVSRRISARLCYGHGNSG